MKWICFLAVCGITGGALAQIKPRYENDFEKAELGKVPEDVLVLNGAFAVQQTNGNKFLEMPGAPLDDYSLIFGPTESAGLMVSARIQATRQGRRFPAFAVGLNGAGGYELQVAPAKKSLELLKGETRVANVPYAWESDTWTVMKLQVRKVKEGEWKVEGKAWKHGAPEPAGWLISYEEKAEPPAGRALISGHAYSGTPIRFDDLQITPAKE
jgi:hypothetical protein